MGNKLYVGNLSFNTTETDLQDYFAQAGPVTEVLLVQDKFTGKSRGFAFVTMSNDGDAQTAITQFHGKPFDGRTLTVNEARPREIGPAAVVVAMGEGAVVAAVTEEGAAVVVAVAMGEAGEEAAGAATADAVGVGAAAAAAGGIAIVVGIAVAKEPSVFRRTRQNFQRGPDSSGPRFCLPAGLRS